MFAGATGRGTGAGSTPSQFAGSTPSQPQALTADQIKQKYAKGKGDVAGTMGVMSAAKGKLEERGEKLRGLQEKTARMESEAMGFEDLARKLATREKAKKWWQL